MIALDRAYLDRACSPAETVARMQPMLAGYGITRVARQTGLDTIGLHCFAALRPNSKTLCSLQGKGLTEDAARASAIMEAIEYAVAEEPEAAPRLACANELHAMGILTVDPSRFMPEGYSFDTSRTIAWYAGHGLVTFRPFAVPADLVRLDGRAQDLKGICQNTNGLASGNTEAEAVFHGLCELVERDAQTLWLLRSEAARHDSAFDLGAFDDPVVRDLIAQITEAGLELRLFDQTTDVGVPVIAAIVGDRAGDRKKFAMAAGYGAHPLAHRAAIRALTEAAQTRVTSIAGARDDIVPAEYAEQMGDTARTLLEVAPNGKAAPRDCDVGGDTNGLIRALSSRLMRANLAEPVVVPLRCSDDGLAVVRVLSEDLEDAEVNLHWRPGKRAVRLIAGQ